MIPDNLLWLADHIWQSTLFAGVAALLAIMLRNNRASVRYWIWMAASVKFLIPFSLLVAIGSQYEWRPISAIAKPGLVSALGGISQPFSPAPEAQERISAATVSAEIPEQTSRVPALLFGVWLCGLSVVGASWFRQWQRMRKVLVASSPLALKTSIKAVSSAACLEPGVVGILRPVLLLPDGIMERLSSEQLKAILIHELCHVRRRDNLAAAVHMVVETLFWFHPLVWWLERRLVAERERACDQEVLRLLGEPEVYAEGILNVCKFYKESPLVCVSGVTGSNLKNRIEEIMMNRVLHNLGIARTLLLVIVALAAVALPVGFGIVRASQDSPKAAAPSPEVTSTSTEAPALFGQQAQDRTPTPQDRNVRQQPTQEKNTSEGWLEQIEAAGFRNLNIDQLIRLKEHEIDAQYIQSVRAQGFDLNADQLVRFREHEITGDFIKEMEQVGLRNLNADELIRLKEHDATPARIRSIQEMGYPNISTNDVVRLLEHEVTPEFIREVKNRFKDATLDQLIRLKEYDIFSGR